MPDGQWINESDISGVNGVPHEPPPLTIIIDEDDSNENGGETDVSMEERADGSLVISLNGERSGPEDRGGADKHDANLAEYIDRAELSRISDELLNGIDADIQTRRSWLDTRAAGIKHLALKVENPRSPSADADTAVEGQSTVRTPILLDAVLRFQANARGELLPAGGPVKIRNDSIPSKTSARAAGELADALAMGAPPVPDESDLEAEALEKDFNAFLTVRDKEYYPDTNRMFFMQGFGGCGFKKVYRCPIRRRPVSRSVDAADIIVSENEVSLQECGRVTHRIYMRPSVLLRMQLAGSYRKVDLMPPIAPAPDAVEQAEDDVAGLSPLAMRPQDYRHTIYESYCELDIAGFQHKENRKYTGLPLPYRVTLDKDSQEILEIRRNWRENDDSYMARMPIVKYPFVEGLGFYGIGLLNIMGNATAAITTAWRLALDAGAFASWPGFLYSDTVGRQDTMTFRVGLASGVRVNTGGNDIRQHIMALPYKDVTAGLVQTTMHVEEEARRVGGTPELMTGEGRQETPVGTTLAMLDQAVKVIDSVHKGMHCAQAEEFSLLRDLFIEDPDALICGNPKPARKWEREELIRALTNCNLTPQSDPNTPSHTIRVMKAVALVQMVQMTPENFSMPAVIRRVASMVGLGSVDELMQTPQQAGADPKHLEAVGKLQMQMEQIKQKTQDSQVKAQLASIQSGLDMAVERLKLQNNREERMSRERIAAAKLAQERLQLEEGALIHPENTGAAAQFLAQQPPMVSISSGGGGYRYGGRVL